jgi:3,4-dihydroxy-9,10-secoandrosta-1,3,5(10)-triene-9,17-dione 4,5-dioxygenase
MGIGIRSLGYLRVETGDLEEWRTFAGKVLGLAEGRGPRPDHLYLRMDELAARIVVAPGERDRLVASGWELADSAALAAAVRRLEQHGVPVEAGTAEELADRRVQEMVRFTDPFGNQLELFHGAAYLPGPAVTPYATRFRTGRQGLGHLVLPVTDDAAALDFYVDLLGLRLRDSMRLDGELVGAGPGSTVWLRFLGCNPRHHSLALVTMPAPAGCVHVMLEVESLDDVGRAMERAQRRRVPVSATLGRHMNDHMLSFYVRSPSGFDVEYGCDGLLVDDEGWVARESTAVSAWGHRFDG